MARPSMLPTARARPRTTVSGAALVLALLTGAAAAQEAGPPAPRPVPGSLPNFVIDGEVRHEGRRWEARDFTGRIGEMPVRGSLAVELGGELPFVGGSMELPSFDLDAFRSMLEQTLGVGPLDSEQDQGVIPSFDLRAQQLERLTMELDLTLSDIAGLFGLIDAASGHVSIKERRLALDPLEITTRSGRITGEAALNARQETPSADLILDLEDVDLAPLLQDTAAADYFSGVVSGRLELLGVGETLRQVLDTAEGEASILIQDGWIKGIVLEAAGIDIVETLALYLGESERIPVACGRVDIVVSEGVAEITRMIIDNRDSIVVGAGTLDLATEELDLAVQTRARDFSLIDADAPILVEGTLADPSFAVGEADGFPPEASPVEAGGDAKPISCERLLEADFSRATD